MKKTTNSEVNSTKGNLAVVKDIAPATDNMEANLKGVTMEIPMDKIKLNSKNKFGIRNIDELADSLKQYGQLHNVVVRKIVDPDFEYEMISGERRYEAAKKIGWTALQAKVVEADEVDSEMLLIVANLETRELNDMERSENAKRLSELIQEKRKQGEDFGGKKTREIIAEKMNIQPAQVQKLIKLQELIPEFKKLVEDKVLSLETANQYAQMEPHIQTLVYNTLQEGISLTAKEAKELKDKLQKVENDEQESLKLIESLTDKVKNLEADKEKAIEELNSKHKEELDKKEAEKQAVTAELTEAKAKLEDKQKKASEATKKLREQLEAEIKAQNAESIKELQDKLKLAEENELKLKAEIEENEKKADEVSKQLEDEIKDIKKEADEQVSKIKAEYKEKEIKQQNIELNMELLALAKQANNLLATLVNKTAEVKSMEGFEMTDEVKAAIANVAKFGNDITSKK